MDGDADVYLLLAGLVRVLIFCLGVAYAFRFKHWWMTLAFASASCSSSVFALSNAGIHVPHWAFVVASYASTPIAAMLLGAAVLNSVSRHEDRDRWRP